MDRRSLLISAVPLLIAPRLLASRGTLQKAVTPLAAALDGILDRAAFLAPLETSLVAQRGEIVGERGYRGHSPAAPTNIKSVSKAIISAATTWR